MKTVRDQMREMLRNAASGGHTYDDEVDDLALPKRERAALVDALAKQRQAAGDRKAEWRARGQAAVYADAIASALPAGHETAGEHRRRRASLGDPAALRDERDADASTSAMVDEIMQRSGVSAK